MKIEFEDIHCNCTRKHGFPDWCEYWRASEITKPFCVLNGGLTSRFCPEAIPLNIDGKEVGDYFSSDKSVCNRAKRKNVKRPYILFSNRKAYIAKHS